MLGMKRSFFIIPVVPWSRSRFLCSCRSSPLLLNAWWEVVQSRNICSDYTLDVCPQKPRWLSSNVFLPPVLIMTISESNVSDVSDVLASSLERLHVFPLFQVHKQCRHYCCPVELSQKFNKKKKLLSGVKLNYINTFCRLHLVHFLYWTFLSLLISFFSF